MSQVCPDANLLIRLIWESFLYILVWDLKNLLISHIISVKRNKYQYVQDILGNRSFVSIVKRNIHVSLSSIKFGWARWNEREMKVPWKSQFVICGSNLTCLLNQRCMSLRKFWTIDRNYSVIVLCCSKIKIKKKEKKVDEEWRNVAKLLSCLLTSRWSWSYLLNKSSVNMAQGMSSLTYFNNLKKNLIQSQSSHNPTHLCLLCIWHIFCIH